jgi:hypothetical protein
MSFVLRFFHAPHITTVCEALAWADGRRNAEPIARNPHFARFVESISEFYPDLSADDDDDGDDSRNLWPEGLESTDTDGAVVNVLINTNMLDEGVMSVIAQHAAGAGLQVLDEQNGLLYGPGYRYIGLTDTEDSPLPDITDHARSVMTENVRRLRFDLVQKKLADTCKRGLGKGCKSATGPFGTVVRRDHGELRQMLVLRVARSTDRRNARVYCRLGFASEALTQQWLPLLPDAFAQRRLNYDRAAGGTALQFECFVPDLASTTLPTGLSLATLSEMLVGDAKQLKALLGGVKLWASGTLLPFLDQVRTLDDLLPLFINEASLAHARKGRMAFPIYPAMLALARRAGQQTLGDYVQAYKANTDFKRLCTLFKDQEGAHFDALVEGLSC